MTAQQVLEQVLQLGGAPVQLAALAWLLVRVEQLHRDSKRLEARIELLEQVQLEQLQDARARG